MVNSLHLIRNTTTQIGTNPLGTANQAQSVKQGVANKSKFDDFLLDAMNSVNEKQIDASNISEQVITDPDSVDVHDVTIAMAEANLSLTMANTVVDRMLKAWQEITTTR